MPQDTCLLAIATLQLSFAIFCISTAQAVRSDRPLISNITKQDSNCRAAVQSVRSQIQTGRNIQVLPAVSVDISSSYPDAPSGRPDGYIISFRGIESQNIMHSPRFMTSLANQIIAQCPTVGLVILGVANSGDFVAFGLRPSGNIQIFRCTESVDQDRPRWGQRICL